MFCLLLIVGCWLFPRLRFVFCCLRLGGVLFLVYFASILGCLCEVGILCLVVWLLLDGG